MGSTVPSEPSLDWYFPQIGAPARRHGIGPSDWDRPPFDIVLPKWSRWPCWMPLSA